ncbi:ribosome small subunit-dependent GTPase A [Klenkia sp. PcliD-1-E]|uniref:ribosome small subunit-dependent GTPase A n=1 Tax=Klenkia sp. PcliD-1-E TaxID=2954492 RepID=UPI002096C8C7|nr:ribosome small subunit-dependent GTPase A [Klenkia sp. PcliD-1-E]MCO7218835.1 ribosome small subunit-dependent GTPase A [Klenkia sp. PcliD-1-E]
MTVHHPQVPAWGTAAPAAPRGTRLGRVVRVDRGLLTLATAEGPVRLPPDPRLHEDGPPAVGDWVAVTGERVAQVLPRQSALTRTVAGRTSAAQVLAANVDLVLVVDTLVEHARLRRIERFLAMAWGSGAVPLVVLTKADACADVRSAVEQVAEDAVGVAVLAVSAHTGAGLDELRARLAPGTTCAVVGPSGVGKSTLLNALAGRDAAATTEVRGDGRGRHTTTAAQLHVLPGGALLVDTPGLRELELADDEGLDAAFADVTALLTGCRFRDCAHAGEPGCALAAAIDDGRLDPARYRAWRKLRTEAETTELRRADRVAARRQREKAWGRAVARSRGTSRPR